jgi:hypothetical protein
MSDNAKGLLAVLALVAICILGNFIAMHIG